jgi:hypothetical protein
MTCQRHGGPSRKNAIHLLIGVAAPFIWVAVALPASADPKPAGTNSADHEPQGNGTRNRNIFSMRSPTSNRGYQHTSTSAVGGKTSVQNAMCRHVTVCTIGQDVIPRKVDRPAQHKVATAAPAHAAAPERASSFPPGTLMYSGPLGYAVMTPPFTTSPFATSPFAGMAGWAVPADGEQANQPTPAARPR